MNIHQIQRRRCLFGASALTKIYLSFFLALTCIVRLNAQEPAEKPAKSGIVVGVITAVDGDTIEVLEKRGNRTHTLKVTSSTSKDFVGSLKTTKEIKTGYPVRAQVAKGTLSKLYVTMPIQQVVITPTPEMVKMSPAEVFKIADENGDGKVSYVELSTKIKASLKHGPVTFSKSDKDQTGGLNVKEFGAALEKIKWWKMSRKTPEEWFKFSDKDMNGKLNKKELAILLGSNAHMEVFFPKADSNKSGDLDQTEVAAYIQTLIFPTEKKKKKK